MFRRSPYPLGLSSIISGFFSGKTVHKEDYTSQPAEKFTPSKVSSTMKEAKYATGMDFLKEDSWEKATDHHEADLLAKHQKVDDDGGSKFSNSNNNNNNDSTTMRQQQEILKQKRDLHLQQQQQKQQQQQDSSLATAAGGKKNKLQQKQTSSGWMTGAEWASIGEEFKGVDPSKFLKRVPDGFLTSRAVTDIEPAEELLSDYLAVTKETYKDVDVRDPGTVTKIEGEKPKWLTMGGKVRAVSEFISGHIAHQVSLPVWQDTFDLKGNMEMDLMFWLWVIHLHIVARRATSVKIDIWSRRREVLEELTCTMYNSWDFTAEEVMGRPPLSKIKNYIKDMYYVTALNIEEALLQDGPGGDLALLGVLVKFCPIPRPEDIPLYTYYTLVHYIRFHIALFDRISDEEFSRGNFNFFPPDDPAIFKSYSDCAFDEVVRDWKAQGMEDFAAEQEEPKKKEEQEQEGEEEKGKEEEQKEERSVGEDKK